MLVICQLVSYSHINQDQESQPCEIGNISHHCQETKAYYNPTNIIALNSVQRCKESEKCQVKVYNMRFRKIELKEYDYSINFPNNEKKT